MNGLGLAWLGLAWLGLAWLGLAWRLVQHAQQQRATVQYIGVTEPGHA